MKPIYKYDYNTKEWVKQKPIYPTKGVVLKGVGEYVEKLSAAVDKLHKKNIKVFGECKDCWWGMCGRQFK